MADTQPFQLFFQILDDQTCDFGRAVERVVQAISAHDVLKSEKGVAQAARAFESSHATRDGLKLLDLVDNRAFLIPDIAMPVHLLMALRGHAASELTVARVLMHHQFWSSSSSDRPQAERDRRLLQALGWLSHAAGCTTFDAFRMSADNRRTAAWQGYAIAQRIKSMRDLSCNLDDTVNERFDRQVLPGEDRYGERAEPGQHRVPTLNADTGLPEYICGHVASHIYGGGYDDPALSLGVTARRIMARFPVFAGHCEAIIDDGADHSRAWRLIEVMEAPDQTAFDCREEVEAMLLALAQRGDRRALCRSAAYAMRRAYHGADTDMLEIALGMLSVASGAREVSDADGSAHVAIKRAGEFVMKLMRERAEYEARAAVEAEAKKAAEVAAEAEPDPDSEEKPAAAQDMLEPTVTESELDDLTNDPGMPETAVEILRAKKLELRVLKAKERFLESVERVVILREIGNRDSKDSKQVVAELASMQKPLPLAKMPFDLSGWRSDLVREFPHATAPIDTIVGDLVARQAADKKSFVIRPTLLIGAPGTGKSRLARRIAETADVAFRMISAAGVADSMFAGCARGWHTGHPSIPFDVVRSSRCPNPILLIDEIEKAGLSRHNGNLVDSLLPMLEPETAAAWSDPYVQAPVNLSYVNWLFTCNSLSGLPGPFLDRVRIVRVDEPGIHHLSDLAASIVRDLAARSGHAGWLPALDGDELAAISRGWKRHGSIRHLQKLVEACLRAREQAAVRH